MADLDEERFCDRCGSPLDAAPAGGRQRPVCPACGRVVYRQLKVGAGVVVEQDGALLLAQRSAASDAFPGAWNLPAGYCEADEPPAMTAVREVAEEIGMVVDVGQLAGVYYFDDDPRGNGLLVVYRATVAGGALRTRPEEVARVAFFRPDALPVPLAGGGHDQAIRAWQSRALSRWQPGMPMRYCPHCTHPLEPRWVADRVRAACPGCGFVHFEGPKLGVAVIVEQGDRVLLVRRAIEPGRGKWCLPAGFVEADEAPEPAAVRECLEETGLAVELEGLIEAQHYTEDFRGPGISLLYAARPAGGALAPGDDVDQARFFSREELPPAGAIAFANHRAAVERWRAGVK